MARACSKKKSPLSEVDIRLMFAASDRDADILYATQFFAPDPFIYFQYRGQSHMVMNDLEIDRARLQARVDQVLSLSQIQQQLRQDGVRVCNTVAVLDKLFTQKKIHMVLVPYLFPAGLAGELRRRGYHIRVKPGPFLDEREIKQRNELKEIESAQQAAEKGLQAAIDLIRETQITSNGQLIHNGDKLTSERVKYRINTVLLSHGYLATHTIVAGGLQGCDPHNEGHGPLPAHEPIILDIFPRSQKSGYWGDITRTIVRGRATDKVKTIYDSVVKAQLQALNQLQPGASGKKIHQSISTYFEQKGFSTGLQHGRMEGFFHGTGHGVGLEIHEPPHIGSRTDSILRCGQVVTIEPGLYYSKVGGVRIEDLVFITPKGYRNLTRFPKILEI